MFFLHWMWPYSVSLLLLWVASAAKTNDGNMARNLIRQEMTVNAGENITLPCGDNSVKNLHVKWVWNTGPDQKRFHTSKKDGNLSIVGVVPEDSKVYTCQDTESNQSIHTVLVQVLTVPPRVTNLTVKTNSVFAVVTWHLPGNGGSPVRGFKLSYRMDKSHLSQEEEEELSRSPQRKSSYNWTTVSDVAGNATSYSVYHLMPNSSYYFRVCAFNDLGCGKDHSVAANTKYNRDEVDAAKELMAKEKDSYRNNVDDETPYLKIWIVGISVILVTFAVIGFGISLLLIKNCDHTRRTSSCEATEEEAMELVPHITLNPSFNIDMLEYLSGGTSSSGRPSTNEDAIVDAINRQQHVQLIETGDDEELNLVNSPMRQQSNNGGHINSKD